jgi:hypothetical protein
MNGLFLDLLSKLKLKKLHINKKTNNWISENLFVYLFQFFEKMPE